MKGFPVRLSVVVGSHLNDAGFVIETHPASAHNHIEFVKALTFLNPDLEKDVTTEYLDFIWDAVVKGDFSSIKSFEEYK